MAVSKDRMTVVLVRAEKKPWTVPVLQMISIHDALGATTGTKCDRYGSLSHGTGC